MTDPLDPRWLTWMEAVPCRQGKDPTGRRQRQDLANLFLCIPAAWLARLSLGQLLRLEAVLASRGFGQPPGRTVEQDAAAGTLHQAQDLARRLALLRGRIAGATAGHRARHGAAASGWDLDSMPDATLRHVAAGSGRPGRRQAAAEALARRNGKGRNPQA